MSLRVAVVAGPDPGHAFPAVALALRLRTRGHDVLVASGDRWAGALAAAGLEFLRLPLLAPDPRDANFGFVLWGRGRMMAPPLAELLTPWRPDVVVNDTLTVAGWFAADLLGVPRVELVPHGLQLPSAALPPPGSGLAPGRGLPGRLRDGLLRYFAGRSYAAAAGAARAARAALGLAGDGVPAARLVATIPLLEPGRPDWPARTHVVGPLEWDPAVADLEPPPGDGPLVFLADSSAAGRPQTLLAYAVAGLAGSGVRIVATRFGGYERVAGFAVAGPGRQAPLLARSAAVVCAGGHGMVAKALSRGLPLVVVPGPGDQRENAVRVARLGAGIHLPASRVSAASLAAAVRAVLEDPAYAGGAARARASAASVPESLAAEVVESVTSRPA